MRMCIERAKANQKNACAKLQYARDMWLPLNARRNLLFVLALSAELRSSIDFQENAASIWKTRLWMLKFIQYHLSSDSIIFLHLQFVFASAVCCFSLLLPLMLVEFRRTSCSSKSVLIRFIFVLYYYFESLFNVKCVCVIRIHFAVWATFSEWKLSSHNEHLNW